MWLSCSTGKAAIILNTQSTRHRIWSRHKGNGESQLPLSASNFFPSIRLFSLIKFSCRIYFSAVPFIVWWFSPPIVFTGQLPLWKFTAPVIESSLAGDAAKKRASLCSQDRPVAKLTPAGIYVYVYVYIRKSGPHLERENPLSARNVDLSTASA